MLLPIKLNKSILALGSEFDTRMAFYCGGEIIFSENTGNLAENPEELEKFILDFLQQKPDIIITDLHPLYNSRKIGIKLAKKWRVPHISAQHHIAHIFSAVGDYIFQMRDTQYKILNTDFYGIACDGTGYGLDENIWGGEVFKIGTTFPPFQMGIKGDFSEDGGENRNLIEGSSFTHGKISPTPLWERWESIQRIGHLEEQYLIGGELAVKESARMVISILSKILSKREVFTYVKKYYSAREFNLLWNQLEQKFNCAITTSAGRVLDAVSLFLGFCENERKYKHYPIKMLEENSAVLDNASTVVNCKIKKNQNGEYVLNTTHLFKYLADNLKSIDKPKLGAMAQRYIIEGLYEIAWRQDCKIHFNPPLIKRELRKVFFSGGLAENKIMKRFAKDNNIYIPQEIPCGDAGIAFGQITVFLSDVHLRNHQNNLMHQ